MTVGSWPAPYRRGGAADRLRRSRYLLRRCTRVRLSSLRCFFLRMRLRRFLMSDPMRGSRLAAAFHGASRGVRLLGETARLVTKSGARGFGRASVEGVTSHDRSRVVQLAEHQTLNLGVAGSSPAPRTPTKNELPSNCSGSDRSVPMEKYLPRYRRGRQPSRRRPLWFFHVRGLGSRQPDLGSRCERGEAGRLTSPVRRHRESA